VTLSDYLGASVMTTPRREAAPSRLAELARASSGKEVATVAVEVSAGDWRTGSCSQQAEPYVSLPKIVFHRDGDRWSEVSGSDTPGGRSTGNGGGFVTLGEGR